MTKRRKLSTAFKKKVAFVAYRGQPCAVTKLYKSLGLIMTFTLSRSAH